MKSKKKVAIIGLGLLGTSLALAVDRKKYELLAWTRNPKVRDWAKSNIPDSCIFETPEAIFTEADLLILCIPVPCIIEFIQKYASLMKKSAVLTDIGSVKSPIEKAAEQIPGLRFIGSHPMAGTEKTGPMNAFRELYENSDVFIVPPLNAEETDTQKIEELWKSIGTKTFRIGAKVHDVLVAHTSHVPHVIACSLVLSVLDQVGPAELRNRFAGCATGFRDTSRIASSSAKMWREIIEQNTPAVLEAMQSYRECFDRLENEFRRGDFDAFEKEFARGAELRNEWLKYKKF